MGDLGNAIWSDATGHGYFDRTYGLLNFTAVNANIIGRGIVLHNATDDGTGTTGNSGNKMAVGVIGISNQTAPITSFKAVALIAGANAGSEAVTGSVTFTQIAGAGDVQIDVSISGLPVGTYGFHVHQYVSETAHARWRLSHCSPACERCSGDELAC
jgi:Cu/Zn superoxide dismutase